MIGYSCTNCGHAFGVQDDYSGKRIKCPRCNFVGVVIDDSGRIKITCQNCGNENNVPENIDGKEIICPKCNNIVIAASVERKPAESSDNDLQEKKHPKPKKSELSEHSLIIIISSIAAVIVAGLIIMAAVIPSYKLRKARKSQDIQSQQQTNDTQPTEQNVQSSRKDALRQRYPTTSKRLAKRKKKIAIFWAIAIPFFILLFFWIHWCPNCHKMWAMKRISPFFHFGDTTDYECKYCGYMKSHSRGGL
ncbi:MAG: hypothetical protein ACYS17_13005 [Planctomycetota bacterium]|jgi:DNA-directed RNA polymerase subunit RPC12/RpoP